MGMLVKRRFIVPGVAGAGYVSERIGTPFVPVNTGVSCAQWLQKTLHRPSGSPWLTRLAPFAMRKPQFVAGENATATELVSSKVALESVMPLPPGAVPTR